MERGSRLRRRCGPWPTLWVSHWRRSPTQSSRSRSRGAETPHRKGPYLGQQVRGQRNQAIQCFTERIGRVYTDCHASRWAGGHNLARPGTNTPRRFSDGGVRMRTITTTVTEAVRLYTVAQAADLLNTSVHTVYRLINDGTLTQTDIGSNSRARLRVRADTLQTYIDARTTHPKGRS